MPHQLQFDALVAVLTDSDVILGCTELLLSEK